MKNNKIFFGKLEKERSKMETNYNQKDKVFDYLKIKVDDSNPE